MAIPRKILAFGPLELPRISLEIHQNVLETLRHVLLIVYWSFLKTLLEFLRHFLGFPTHFFEVLSNLLDFPRKFVDIPKKFFEFQTRPQDKLPQTLPAVLETKHCTVPKFFGTLPEKCPSTYKPTSKCQMSRV